MLRKSYLLERHQARELILKQQIMNKLPNNTINFFYQKETKEVLKISKCKLFKYKLYMVCIYGFNIWVFIKTNHRNLI